VIRAAEFLTDDDACAQFAAPMRANVIEGTRCTAFGPKEDETLSTQVNRDRLLAQFSRW
jgi:hypothetical protein